MRRWLFAMALAGVLACAACDGVTNTAGLAGEDDARAATPDAATPDDVADNTPDASVPPADVPAAPADVPLVDTGLPPADVPTDEGDVPVASDVPSAPPDVPPPPDYPLGPYGAEAGETIENLTFYSTTGEELDLKSFYGQEKVIVLVSAAGWCGYCQDEAMTFNSFYEGYDDKGLVLIYTLFEDDQGRPITPSFVQSWIDNLGLVYPCYQDRGFKMGDFYPEDGTPMNMVITTKDMQIRYVENGYSSFDVLYWAKKYIYGQED